MHTQQVLYSTKFWQGEVVMNLEKQMSFANIHPVKFQNCTKYKLDVQATYSPKFSLPNSEMINQLKFYLARILRFVVCIYVYYTQKLSFLYLDAYSICMYLCTHVCVNYRVHMHTGICLRFC